MKKTKKLLFFPLLFLSTSVSCANNEDNECSTTLEQECQKQECTTTECNDASVYEDDLTINYSSMELLVGTERQLEASSSTPNAKFTFSSSSPANVEVTSTGLVKALVANRYVKITVSCSNGLSKEIEVRTHHENTYFTFNGQSLTGCVDTYAEELTLPLTNSSGQTMNIIVAGAFKNFPRLKKLTIPEGYTKIEEFALILGNLVELNVPSTLSNFANQWLMRIRDFNIAEGNTALKTYQNGSIIAGTANNQYQYNRNRIFCTTSRFDGNAPEEIASDGINMAMYGSFINVDGPTHYVFPQGFPIISQGAFAGNTKVESVTIPCNNNIGGNYPGYTFSNCSSLKEIKFHDDPALFEGDSPKLRYFKNSDDEVIGVTDGKFVIPNDHKSLLSADATSVLVGTSDFSIPNTVTSLGLNSYQGKGLKGKIRIPSHVESVQTNAFVHNPGIEKIFVPSTTTMNTSSFTVAGSLATNNYTLYLQFAWDLDNGISFLTPELSTGLYGTTSFNVLALASIDLVIYSNESLDTSHVMFDSGYGTKYKFKVLEATEGKTSEQLFDELD